jgi:signal transduction histidine kinase
VTWLPQTLFGRLFAAMLAAIAATLLVIVLLVLQERRDLVFAESGAGAAANSIVERSVYLAKLPRAERAQELAKMRAEAVGVELSAPSARLVSRRREAAEVLEQVLRNKIREALGEGYDVDVAPPSIPRELAISLEPERRELGPEGLPPGGRGRMVDVSVLLPDGERLVFRAPAPRPAPPLPQQLFLQLGVLTLVLGTVLYLMTRSITKPLGRLARAADAFGRGESVVPVEEEGVREIKRATRAFNAMQERLKRYLDSRTRVLAAMSHDLRTPLTRLRLRVESIEEDELRSRCVDDIEEMTSMVRGALGLFRGLNDEEPSSPIDIDGLLHDLERQYGEMGKRVSATGSTHAPFSGRALAIKRLLCNLVDNALQFGSEAQLRVSDGNELHIAVLDDGPGIEAEYLEQVFEPFFRLESSRNRATGGTGLGLSIARDIAQAHGGSLVLKNRAEGGLEALLTLPRKDLASAAHSS